MLSLCFSHMATVASPFRSSIFHFLAKFLKFAEIFFSWEKKAMKLNLLRKNTKTSSHRKGNLLALTAVYQFGLWIKVWDIPSELSLPRQEPWSLVGGKQVFELPEVELTVFHCMSLSYRALYSCFSILWMTLSLNWSLLKYDATMVIPLLTNLFIIACWLRHHTNFIALLTDWQLCCQLYKTVVTSLVLINGDSIPNKEVQGILRENSQT